MGDNVGGVVGVYSWTDGLRGQFDVLDDPLRSFLSSQKQDYGSVGLPFFRLF